MIKRQGFSRKKARFFGKPADLGTKTDCFLAHRDALIAENRQFVALDETGFGRNSGCTVGYAPVGQQLRVQRQAPRFTTTSVIAVASQSGIIARRSRHGSFNTQRLLEFLETLHLAAGTVFLLDNVSFHHAKEVKALACQRGWTLLYTPPYSPWFNPIEGMFSIVKRAFYKNGSIDHAFSRLTQSHAGAFFGQSLRLRKQPT